MRRGRVDEGGGGRGGSAPPRGRGSAALVASAAPTQSRPTPSSGRGVGLALGRDWQWEDWGVWEGRLQQGQRAPESGLSGAQRLAPTQESAIAPPRKEQYPPAQVLILIFASLIRHKMLPPIPTAMCTFRLRRRPPALALAPTSGLPMAAPSPRQMVYACARGTARALAGAASAAPPQGRPTALLGRGMG